MAAHLPGERRSRRALLAALPALLLPLAGCGFQLRRAPEFGFRSILLSGFDPRSPLADELRMHIDASPTTRVVDTLAQAQVVLHALTDARERSVAASTSAGQVRELQLRLRFAFRLTRPDGSELIPARELVLTRDMSYSETIALAKELEENALYRAMQSDIANQVLRRLAAVPPV